MSEHNFQGGFERSNQEAGQEDKEKLQEELIKLIPPALRAEFLSDKDQVEVDNYLMGGLNLTTVLAEDRTAILRQILAIPNILLMPRGGGYWVFWYFGDATQVAAELAWVWQKLRETQTAGWDKLLISVGKRPQEPLVFRRIRVDNGKEAKTAWAQQPVTDEAVLAGALGAKQLSVLSSYSESAAAAPVLLMSPEEDGDKVMSLEIKGVPRTACWTSIEARPPALSDPSSLSEAQRAELLGTEFYSYLPVGELSQKMVDLTAVQLRAGEAGERQSDSLIQALDLAGMSQLVQFAQQTGYTGQLAELMSDWQEYYTKLLTRINFYVNEYGGDGAMAVLPGNNAIEWKSLLLQLFELENSFVHVWQQKFSSGDEQMKDFIRQYQNQYLLPVMKVMLAQSTARLELLIGDQSGAVRLQHTQDIEAVFAGIKCWWSEINLKIMGGDRDGWYLNHQIVAIDATTYAVLEGQKDKLEQQGMKLQRYQDRRDPEKVYYFVYRNRNKTTLAIKNSG